MADVLKRRSSSCETEIVLHSCRPAACRDLLCRRGGTAAGTGRESGRRGAERFPAERRVAAQIAGDHARPRAPGFDARPDRCLHEGRDGLGDAPGRARQGVDDATKGDLGGHAHQADRDRRVSAELGANGTAVSAGLSGELHAIRGR